MARHTDKRRGFTLVEATIVVVVIALILTFTIPWMRERERQKLQVLAETEPWEVFEFRAQPARERWAYDEHEEILVQCEIVNLTDYPLVWKGDFNAFDTEFSLTEGDTETIMGYEPNYAYDPHPISEKRNIAPGEKWTFELLFYLYRPGEVEVRITPSIVQREFQRFQSNLFTLICFNRTPEELARNVLDSLRSQNIRHYVTETLFTKQQAQQFATQIQNGSSVATEVEAFPWLGEFENVRQENIASWERILSQGIESGITWRKVYFVRAEYDVKERMDIRSTPGTTIFFSSNGSVYKIYIDDCFETQDGWLAADALRWQGRAD